MEKSESVARSGEPYVYSVSELTEEIKDLLELEFDHVIVVGEISGYKVSHAGHAYFALKDQHALLNCAIWRSVFIQRAAVPLRDGLSVEVIGRIDVYPPRGSYQLIVDSVRPVGEGDLQRRFEELKKRLLEEGLFDESRKRPLPLAPERIAVITSPTGAAVRDFLKVVRKGYPGLHVQVYPVRVQGAEAPGEIAHALDVLSRLREHDIIILTRGGGSIEDLWAYNEEIVARAISRCPIPVISAVGHEVDFTISDFVADVRAPTPTGAGSILVSQRDSLQNRISELNQRLRTGVRHFLTHYRLEMKRLDEGLRRAWPRRYLDTYRQRLDDSLSALVDRLRAVIGSRRTELETNLERLLVRARRNAAARGRSLAVLEGRLQALAPSATFRRGYAVCSDGTTGRLITSADQVRTGDTISVQVYKGSLEADVTDTYPIRQESMK
jgi:exodeoxyribonuclease VII large subunit